MLQPREPYKTAAYKGKRLQKVARAINVALINTKLTQRLNTLTKTLNGRHDIFLKT